MKLIVVNSNSKGNSYALDSGSEILLLEAGCCPKDVGKSLDFRMDKVVGCICTHRHGDHFKYAWEFSQMGICIYGTEDSVLAGDRPKRKARAFGFGRATALLPEKTIHIGDFDVVPFSNYHDVPIFGYLIRHHQMGTMLFSTDSYKLGMTLRGINHFLIEANYEDSMLKENVKNGSISKAQSDRIMLSHMSLNYCIEYLRDCEADKSAKTITLCHLSERNSDPTIFRNTVAGAFGVPTFIAQKGLVVELNKEDI